MNTPKSLSVGKNMLWNTAGSFIYFFCQWLLTLIVVRVSGNYENAGNFSLAISVTNVFHTSASFALRTYIVSDRENKFSSGQYTAMRIISILLSLILCVLYTSFFDYTSSQLLCIYMYMLFRVGEVIVDLLHSFEQKMDRMDIGGRSLIFRAFLSVISFTVTIKLTDSVAASIIAMLICTYVEILLYDLKNARYFASLLPDFDFPSLKKLMSVGLPITASSVFSIMVTTIPRQTLESLLGSEMLGFYATVATPAVIVQVAATYVYAPMLSSFAKYFREENKKAFLSLFLKVCAILAILTILSVAGSLCFGRFVLTKIYGDKIEQYAYLLVPVIISTAANAFLLLYWNVLVILRKLKTLAAISFSEMLLVILLSKLFINRFGLNGTSFIVTLSYCLGLVLMSFIFICEMKRLGKKRSTSV